MSGAAVLERSVLAEGKVFIKEGQENARAYMIQNGEVSAFITDGEQEVEIARHGPGTIIDEICLLIDEPAKVSYRALSSVTVVTITRADFQKRLSKADQTIGTILDHIVHKLTYYANRETEKALKRSEIDDTALALVHGLVQGLNAEKKEKYKDAMLPHLNGLIKAIKDLKSEQT
ncbi:MAG: Crp/Fnr family transcriptional regulator [Alphaproteobacteria bacterium]